VRLAADLPDEICQLAAQFLKHQYPFFVNI